MNQLLISLENLPEEGKLFEGELNADIFALPQNDSTHPTGNLTYSLFVRRFENELLVRGKLSAPFSFTCVRCLTPYVQTIDLDDFSTLIEIGEQNSIDLTEIIREEIVISLPPHPKCSDGDLSQECNVNSLYLRVDKHPQDGVNSSRTNEDPGVWDVLDSLQ